MHEEYIGWVTPPEDPAALARVIAAAASDAAGTEDKGRRAAVVASRYARQVALNAYRDLMNRLLERQHADHRENLKKSQLNAPAPSSKPNAIGRDPTAIGGTKRLLQSSSPMKYPFGLQARISPVLPS